MAQSYQLAIPIYSCTQPPSYQISPWLFLWGAPTSYSHGYFHEVHAASQLHPVTSDSLDYSYGVHPASQLPAIPMAIPMRCPQPPRNQLFRWLFLHPASQFQLFLFIWGAPSLPVTCFSYCYSDGCAQPPSYQLVLWLFLWGAPSLTDTS